MQRYFRWLGRVWLTLMVGCLAPSVAHSQDNPPAGGALTPPPAGLTLNLDEVNRPDGEVFRIGFLADASPAHQGRLYRPFQERLEATLQQPVDMIPFRDGRGLLMAMVDRDISYAVAPSSLFVATHRQCRCVEPLGVQPNRDGSVGLYAALLVSASSRSLTDLQELEQARLAILGEGSVVAHRVGLADLWHAGLRIDDDQVQFTSTLAEASGWLSQGSVDAVLTWTRQAEGRVVLDHEPFAALPVEVRSDLRVLWRSRMIPPLTHYIHADLADDRRALLAETLIGLTGIDADAFDAIDRGSGRGFVAQTLSDYQPLIDAFAYWDQQE